MVCCAARGCTNKSCSKSKLQLLLEKDGKITFHRFPNNSDIRKTWAENMGLTNTSITKQSRICSLHFSNESFDRTSACRTRLRADAIPTLRKLGDVLENKELNEQPSDTNIEIHSSLDLAESELKRSRVDANTYMDEIEEPANKQSKIAMPENDCCNSSDNASSAAQPPPKSYADKATWISKSMILNSPTKVHLRKTIEELKDSHRKKVRVLQQARRRQDKRIASLQNVLNGLNKQKQLSEEELDILKNIGTSNIHLLKRVVKKSKNAVLPKKFTPELRSFALTLHYYSPRAYNYVRQKFDSCLPHPKTLSKWYRSINGEPGFNAEALESIKERVKLVDQSLVGSLIFDEMSIRQHVEYDGNKFSGYVDMGADIASDTLTPAKEALVFLFVCMNGSWKIPVGFFLTAGITANQKANLLNQCITMLHESGVRVISVTFDGAPTNMSMAKQMGCKLDNPVDLHPSFAHPVTTEKVFITPDPCHMVKLVRNTLGDLKSIMNGNGELILWKYVEELHKIQEKEGLHLGNKLRSAHIDYHKQKMKVKFATQVFSSSVADGIKLCRTDLKLDFFQNSAATEEFLKLFNDLFDIFNSKNLKQAGFKKPIQALNKYEIIAKLDECRDYILQLKETKTGRKIVDTQRKMGFLGFLICIESLKGIFHELCEVSNVLTHVAAYKLSQDHVELFFGCIRSHGGHNNNPTARQFKAAFKKMMIHSEIRDTDSGNCIPLENISILHVTSVRKPEDVINFSTPTARLIGGDLMPNLENTSNVLADHSYLPDIRTVSEFSDRIIVYIAGFVVRHLNKSVLCEVCVNALSGTDSDSESALISVKTRGGLHYPSRSVISICRVAEKAIRFALKESGGKFMEKKFSEDYIVSCVLSNLTETTTLFRDLTDHCHDQMALENHSVHLTSAVARKYVKIRFYYIGKRTVDIARSERHKFNKLTIFKDTSSRELKLHVPEMTRICISDSPPNLI